MENPRHWRQKAQRLRLEGTICPACGQVTFPPRACCSTLDALPGLHAALPQTAIPVPAAPAAIALVGYQPSPPCCLAERIKG